MSIWVCILHFQMLSQFLLLWIGLLFVLKKYLFLGRTDNAAELIDQITMISLISPTLMDCDYN